MYTVDDVFSQNPLTPTPGNIMRHVSKLFIGLTGLALVGLVGCQHATDGDGSADAVESAEQASETNIVFRTPTEDESSYLHFGFHPEDGWTFFSQTEPLETNGIDRALAQQGASDSLESALTTSVQAQNGQQGQPGQNGQNGQDGDDQEDNPFGDLTGDSGGPTYSGGSGVAGQSFSARAPQGSNFNASTAGGAGSGPVYSGSSGTTSRFSASASSGAGQVCSLRSLCDFTQAVCEVAPSVFQDDEDLGCGSISRCYSYVDRASAQATADLSRRQVCQISTLFSCAARTIRQVRPQVGSSEEGAFAILGSIFLCASEAGLDTN